MSMIGLQNSALLELNLEDGSFLGYIDAQETINEDETPWFN